MPSRQNDADVERLSVDLCWSSAEVGCSFSNPPIKWTTLNKMDQRLHSNKSPLQQLLDKDRHLEIAQYSGKQEYLWGYSWVAGPIYPVRRALLFLLLLTSPIHMVFHARCNRPAAFLAELHILNQTHWRSCSATLLNSECHAETLFSL